MPLLKPAVCDVAEVGDEQRAVPARAVVVLQPLVLEARLDRVAAANPLEVVLQGIGVQRIEEGPRIGAAPALRRVGTGEGDFGERLRRVARRQSLDSGLLHPIAVDRRIRDRNPEPRRSEADLIQHRRVDHPGVLDLADRGHFIHHARHHVGQRQRNRIAANGAALVVRAAREQHGEPVSVGGIEIDLDVHVGVVESDALVVVEEVVGDAGVRGLRQRILKELGMPKRCGSPE